MTEQELLNFVFAVPVFIVGFCCLLPPSRRHWWIYIDDGSNVLIRASSSLHVICMNEHMGFENGI